MGDCVSSAATEFLRHTIQPESPITTRMNSWTVIWKRTKHVEGIQQATSEIIANSIQKCLSKERNKNTLLRAEVCLNYRMQETTRYDDGLLRIIRINIQLLHAAFWEDFKVLHQWHKNDDAWPKPASGRTTNGNQLSQASWESVLAPSHTFSHKRN